MSRRSYSIISPNLVDLSRQSFQSGIDLWWHSGYERTLKRPKIEQGNQTRVKTQPLLSAIISFLANVFFVLHKYGCTIATLFASALQASQ